LESFFAVPSCLFKAFKSFDHFTIIVIGQNQLITAHDEVTNDHSREDAAKMKSAELAGDFPN